MKSAANAKICTDDGGNVELDKCGDADIKGNANDPQTEYIVDSGDHAGLATYNLVRRGAVCCGGDTAWVDACTEYGSPSDTLTPENKLIYEKKIPKFECSCPGSSDGKTEHSDDNCDDSVAPLNDFMNTRPDRAFNSEMVSTANMAKCINATPNKNGISTAGNNKITYYTCKEKALETMWRTPAGDKEDGVKDFGEFCCPPKPESATLFKSGTFTWGMFTDDACTTPATSSTWGDWGGQSGSLTLGASISAGATCQTVDTNSFFVTGCDNTAKKAPILHMNNESPTCAADATHNHEWSLGCNCMDEDDNGVCQGLWSKFECVESPAAGAPAKPAPIKQTLAATFSIPEGTTEAALLADTTFKTALTTALASQITGVDAADITITGIRFVSRRARSLAVEQKVEIDYTVAVADAAEATAVTTFGSSATTAQLTAMQNSIATTLTSAGSAISSGTVTGVTTAEEDEDSDSAAFVGAKVSAFVAGFAGIAAAMTLF
jgi:hypothetical protein